MSNVLAGVRLGLRMWPAIVVLAVTGCGDSNADNKTVKAVPNAVLQAGIRNKAAEDSGKVDPTKPAPIQQRRH
jgi:hypothetical protein